MSGKLVRYSRLKQESSFFFFFFFSEMLHMMYSYFVRNLFKIPFGFIIIIRISRIIFFLLIWNAYIWIMHLRTEYQQVYSLFMRISEIFKIYWWFFFFVLQIRQYSLSWYGRFMRKLTKNDFFSVIYRWFKIAILQLTI